MSESPTAPERAPESASEPVPGSAAASPGRRPRRVTTAAVLTGLEGVVVAVFGIVSLVMLVTGTPDDMTQAATLAVTVLALAVLPLVAARGLWLLRRWGRGPSTIVQLMAVPIGWQMAQNGGLWTVCGVLIGLAGLTVLGCLINPTATLALGTGPRDETDTGDA